MNPRTILISVLALVFGGSAAVGVNSFIQNPQNKVEQRCRVVRVDDTAERDFAVAFEFDSPNPKFWPVVFPPEDWHAPAPGPSEKSVQ